MRVTVASPPTGCTVDEDVDCLRPTCRDDGPAVAAETSDVT